MTDGTFTANRSRTVPVPADELRNALLDEDGRRDLFPIRTRIAFEVGLDPSSVECPAQLAETGSEWSIARRDEPELTSVSERRVATPRSAAPARLRGRGRA